MKRKITSIAAGMFLGLWGVQAQSTCSDLNGYVSSKNTGPTGSYTLEADSEEKAAQTYHYSGPGRISSVRVYGNYPGSTAGVPLRVGIYNVDADGRPTTLIQSANDTWWWYDNFDGYITVSFGGGGVFVDDNFAITVELRSGSPWGNIFNLQYTGDGEGLGEDLASLAGTSTGFNWSSAMDNFSKNGDFYIVPRMNNFISPAFEVSSTCVATSTPVNFQNESEMTKDRMFNLIASPGYSGPEFFYTWNFGDGSPVSHAENPVHTYSVPGEYTVSLTCTIDGWTTNCSRTITHNISVGLAANASAVTNVSCHGGNNGSLTAAANGGATPYVYSLNGEGYQSSANFAGLSAGNYILYVKDDLGCVSTVGFTITQPSPITFSSPSVTSASCATSNGAISVAATGGVGSLQYQINSGTFQSSGNFPGLSAGVYMVTAKDANSCTATSSVVVNDMGGPSFNLVNSTNVSCNGGNDGSITLSSTGGTGTIQYSINGGASYQTSGTFTGLSAGTYAVVVKDATGCTDISTLVISQPMPVSFSAAATPALCFGSSNGEIEVLSSIGGIGTHTYSVDGVNYQSEGLFEGLAAGTYTVYVKDIAGCFSTSAITVTQPAALSATATTTAVTCHGDYSGSMVINATGGTPGYVYAIDTDDSEGGSQESNTFDELAAGNYTVVVTDDHACAYSFTATITEPAVITATANTTNSTCGNNNGGILVTGAAGGTGSGYQYSIDGSVFNTTGAFPSLSAGTYYIIVKDGASCESVISATVVDSDGPSITSSSHTNVACHGGSDGTITINTVTGGTGVLQYSINGVTWQTSPVFTGLEAGGYVVTVKDANGCTGTATAMLTEPSAFVINTTVSNVDCYGDNSGQVTVFASGGAGTLAYSIDGGDNYQSSSTFTSLYSGMYTVTVRDAAGCYAEADFVVTQSPLIHMYMGVLNVTCNGADNGSIYVYVTGGSGGFEYSLDNIVYQSSNVFSGLGGGTYNVYVRDVNGCTKMRTVTVSEPNPIEITANISHVSCAGGSNGVIDITVTGGTGFNSYEWSTGIHTEDIFGLEDGSYDVTVTDHNGCTATASFTVIEPANPIVINGTVTDAYGSVPNNGAVDITVSGGNPPYEYDWSNTMTSEDIENLYPGGYTVTVTDASGCSAAQSFIVQDVTGVGEVANLSGAINIYPNPSRTYAVIETNGHTIERYEVRNALGQIVLQGDVNRTKVEINTLALNQGVYFVQVKVDGNYITKKLQVLK